MAGRRGINALGPRATSGARPTEGAQPEFISGVKRRRRRAGVGSVKRVQGKRAVVLRMSFCRVGNNSPRTPLIPPRGFAAAAGRGEREDCVPKEGRKGEGMAGRRGIPRCRTAECPHARCSRVLSAPPAVADPARPSPDSRVKGWDSQMFEKSPVGDVRPNVSPVKDADLRGETQGWKGSGGGKRRRGQRDSLTGGMEKNQRGRRGKSASDSPKMLRDGPARVRPANYGGSGEIISPDAFSVFSAFSAFTERCSGSRCRRRGFRR